MGGAKSAKLFHLALNVHAVTDLIQAICDISE